MARKQKKTFKRRPRNVDLRKKFCKFTSMGIKEVDYKDIKLLKEFITETGKIIPARLNDICGLLMERFKASGVSPAAYWRRSKPL